MNMIMGFVGGAFQAQVSGATLAAAAVVKTVTAAGFKIAFVVPAGLMVRAFLAALLVPQPRRRQSSARPRSRRCRDARVVAALRLAPPAHCPPRASRAHCPPRASRAHCPPHTGRPTGCVVSSTFVSTSIGVTASRTAVAISRSRGA